MSIFVSIASYCDPMLAFTLRRAFERARRPADIRFGIVDQSRPGGHLRDFGPVPASQLCSIHIDAAQARGPCWARAVGMSLYQGEDWFLQVDSHTDFEPDWDECFIAQSRALAAVQPRHVISSYPPAFEMIDGEPVRKPSTLKVLAHVVRPGQSFDAQHPALAFEAHPVELDAPVRGFHLGAGCIFAPGEFVQRFPYDPALYFHGEEQSLSLRLFTHGWDIFHMPGLPLSHLYTVGTASRPLHWDEAEDTGRAQRWWQLEALSRQRLDRLVSGDPHLGVFGLGVERSVADYARFSGIDYAGRTVSERAWKGPWSVPDDSGEAAPEAAGRPSSHSADSRLLPALNDEWRQWLAVNLQRGCDPLELRRILLEAGFDPEAVRTDMGAAWPDRPGLTQSPPAFLSTLSRVHPESHCIAAGQSAVYVLDDFLDAQECDAWVAVIAKDVRPSERADRTGLGEGDAAGREAAGLGDPRARDLEREANGRVVEAGLPAQSARAWRRDPVGQAEEPAALVPRATRVAGEGPEPDRERWAVLVYLNDDFAGGAVQFPALGRTLHPVQGRALVWRQHSAEGGRLPEASAQWLAVSAGAQFILTWQVEAWEASLAAAMG